MSNLKSHFFWSFLNSIGSIFVKIGTLVFVSWLISPDVFGIYSIGIAIVLIVSTVVQLGIPTSLATLDEKENLTGLGLILSIVFFLIAASIFYTFIFFSEYEIKDLFIYFTVLTLLQIVINILEASCKRDLNFKVIAKSEIVASFFGSGLLTIILAIKGYGIYSLIVGQIIYCLLKTLYLYLNIKNIFMKQRFTSGNLRRLMSNSGSVTLAELSNITMIQIQRPIIGMQINASAAGIWSRIYQIIIIQLSVIVQPIDYMSLPLLAKIKKDKEHLEKIILALLQIVSIITLLCATFTVFFAPLIIPILLGPKWEALIVPLQIGALIVYFRAVERVLLSISRAIGVMRLRAAIQFIQLLIVIVFLLIFSKNGLLSASWALLGALALGFLISLYTTNLTIGISAKKIMRSIFPGLLLFIVPIFSFYFITEFLFYSYINSLVFSIVVLIILSFFIFLKREMFFEEIVLDLFFKAQNNFKSRFFN